MEYTEVDIRLKQVYPFADLLVSKLNDIEFESYLEYENGLKAYIQTQLLDRSAVTETISEISELTEISFTIKKLKQENWNVKWERNYHPVIINDSCVIRAPFHDSVVDIKYEIIIMPRMSFGTGHHETTKLMIAEMFNLDLNGKSVLDMGSGTGVLAILASKLGASNLVGIDYDDWAFNNAKDNAILNNVSNIQFLYGNSDSIGDKKYDIILANINRNIILNDIEIYFGAMNLGGEILLSGFFKEDVSLILKKIKKLRLKLIVRKNKNRWQMIHLKKV